MVTKVQKDSILIDIEGREIYPGNRVLMASQGYLNEYIFLYKTNKGFVFSKYNESLDPDFPKDEKDYSIKKEYRVERMNKCTYHNDKYYVRYLFQNSVYLLDRSLEKVPEQLLKFLKNE